MVSFVNLSVNLANRPEGEGEPMAPARIGVIVPFDMALDREYWQLVPEDVSLHVTRLGIVDLPYGPAHARQVADPDGLVAATRTLVRIAPRVVAFGCASASFVDGLAGEARIRRAIEGAGVPRAVTPSGALLEALADLGARRVALGTPYEDDLGDRLADFLAEGGLEPGRPVNLRYDDEEDIVAASAAVVTDLAERAMFPGADALFLACTNLPTVPLLPALRRRLGVPVLSANQVLVWSALRHAGVVSPIAAGRA
jgi:maleate isomerase